MSDPIQTPVAPGAPMLESCCAPPPLVFPRAAAAPRPAATAAVVVAVDGPALCDAVPVPGGRAEVGTDHPVLQMDGEGPRRFQRVKPFRLGATAVTNAAFARFVAATGYVTDAERFGWSYVFYRHVQGVAATAGVVGLEWWRRIEGAYWRVPFGPGSGVEGREDHPVVHVSWADATAFAAWAGGRLPSEAEWEHAARGGLAGTIYPWGDRHPDDDSFQPCNIWQGRFPDYDTGADGFAGLAPARSFEPNGYGLFNMSGNCWEWTADYFRVRSLKAAAKAANARFEKEGSRLLKGGSHLCHQSYCHRYRIAARMGNTPDTSTGHIGFRVCFDG